MSEPPKKLKRLTIDLTDEEHRVLKALAAEAGQTMRSCFRPCGAKGCSPEPSKEPDAAS